MPTTSRSSTIIEGDPIPLETVGEILRHEFLDPMGITPYRLAVSIGKPQSYVAKILNGGGVSPEMGILLDRFFGLSSGFFSRLQADYDTRLAYDRIHETVLKVKPAAELQTHP